MDLLILLASCVWGFIAGLFVGYRKGKIDTLIRWRESLEYDNSVLQDMLDKIEEMSDKRDEIKKIEKNESDIQKD